MTTATVFPTLEAFYAEMPERRISAEADYGVHWKLNGWPHPWRVSHVQNTGEIYAVHQCLEMHDVDKRIMSYGPLFVLGKVAPDPVPDGDCRALFYATLEQILDGWAERCWTSNGLARVRDRIAEVRKER